MRDKGEMKTAEGGVGGGEGGIQYQVNILVRHLRYNQIPNSPRRALLMIYCACLPLDKIVQMGRDTL